MEIEKLDFDKMIPCWVEKIHPMDLPELYREMATTIGMKNTMALAQVYAGTSVYFPKLERALITMRNQWIRREFDGANIKALARRWRLSSRHVRQIVNPPHEPSA